MRRISGFGVTQSAFAVEQNMDLLAEALDMDPLELRRINAQRVGATTATGQLLRESVGLLELVIDKVQADMTAHDPNGFRWSWRDDTNGNKAYGWGSPPPTKTPDLAAAHRIKQALRSKRLTMAPSRCALPPPIWARGW